MVMRRLIRSFACALSGLGHGLRTQANLRIHILAAACVTITGWLLQISTIEWAILALTIMVVMSAELFNTAIEAAVDRMGDEPHPLSKIAKDTAAGAVLIGAIGAVIVGVLIFGPRLVTLLGAR
jgi:diacylglycerol kinase